MKMWHWKLISVMCNKHLCGMHGEIHKHRHNFEKQHSMNGRFKDTHNEIAPKEMQRYHDICHIEANERKKAGLMSGKIWDSPYEQPNINYLPKWQQEARPNLQYDIIDLFERCEDCADNFLNAGIVEQVSMINDETLLRINMRCIL